MEIIKDASYQIMLNNKLRQKFVAKYNEFPEYYDKFKLKSKEVRRIFSSHYNDYEKISGVLVAGTKDKNLQKEINEIILKYFTVILMPKITKDSYESTIQVTRYLKSRVHELGYILDYLKKHGEISSPSFPINREEDLCKDIIMAFSAKYESVSFKEMTKKLTIEFNRDVDKTKLDGHWLYIYEHLLTVFGPQKNDFVNDVVGAFSDYKRLKNQTLSVLSGEKDKKSLLTTDADTKEKYSIVNMASSSPGATLPAAVVYTVLNGKRQGIDALALIQNEHLTDKEIRGVVNLVKYNHSMQKAPIPSGLSDWARICFEVVSECFNTLLIKNYKQAISYDGEKPKKEKKSSGNTMLKLKEENERLKKEKYKHDAEVDILKKQSKDEKKALLAEIHALKKQIKELQPEEEIKEVEFKEEITVKDEPIEFTEDDFKKLIKEKKILLWGLREKDAKNVEEKYPEIKTIPSDKTLTTQQVINYDAIIMNTNYTSHSSYFSARDTIKNAGLPIAVLANGSNNEYWLFKAGEELISKFDN